MSKKAKPTVSQNTPWSEVIPYLTGKNGQTGVLPEASRLYGQGGFSPQMQNVNDIFMSQLGQRANVPTEMVGAGLGQFNKGVSDHLMNQAGSVSKGAYDTNFKPVAKVGLQASRQSQGPLDPTNSLQRLLSGNVQNPYLDQQARAMTANLTRNLNENIMPGIRSESLASGQYGGSRQGIAEGLAASRLNQDLAPALTNLYGGAFENAQNRMMGVASDLNNQAVQNSQFNANLGLQNNQQQMQQNQSNLANRMQGLNIAQGANQLQSGQLANLGMGMGLQDQNYNQAMNTLLQPQNVNWMNYQNFSNPILQAAGSGGTQSQTNYKNPAMGALGGAAAGSVFGPLGAIAGGGLGLLGGLF